MNKIKYPCPVCGYYTFSEQPPGTYFICDVCFWEDDPIQYEDHDYKGGANKESLNDARANYKKIGAKSIDVLQLVREPLEAELPSNNQ